MAKHKLTPLEIKHAKCPPGMRLKRISDGDGLFLVLHATGGKTWQFRYEYDKKAQTITVKGATVTEVREEAERLRKMLAAGDDPRVVKRVERAEKIAANKATFEVLKDLWIEQEARRQQWVPHYIAEVKASFENHLKPLFPLPVAKIRARITAPVLEECEKKSPGVVDRVAQRLHSVMDFAVPKGHIEVNPLPKHVPTRTKVTHYAAITNLVPDPKNDIHTSVGDILRAFDKFGAETRRRAHGSVHRAHLLLVFTAMRISEVVNAEWKEFDLEAGTWAIPRRRMKRKDESRGPHLVPLPPTLLAQLRAWHEADGKSGRFVCPSARSPKRPVHGTLVGRTYCDDLELKETHSPHSWRAVFKSVCSDAGKAGEVIEAQLDHVVGNAVASAYDRSQRLELRRELMKWYEQTLIAVRDGATVLPLKKKA